MSDEVSVDVLIAGAGASGLTLAIELARHGVSFQLIEAMNEPFHGSRGKGIQPRTQEIFEDLGIIDRAFAAGGPYPPDREYRSDGTCIDSPPSGTPATPAEPYHHALMVPQFLTEAVMRERLAELGHQPVYGCTLMGLEQAEEFVTARVGVRPDGRKVRARYLVGADGGRSFVRQALHIGFPGKTLGVRAIVADVSLTGLGREVWHRFNRGAVEEQLALCPLCGTDLFQLQAALPMAGSVDLSAQGLTAMVAARSGRDDIRIESVSWASDYTMNARLADRYRVGRVFLIGDAAHIHPPTGGQGLNTSVQDAYNLGWKLAEALAGAPDALLDSYEEERRPVAAGMLGLSTRLLDAAKQGDMRRGREVHQLDLGYQGSSLGLESPPRTQGLRPGDRAPDAPMQGAAGQPVRLFELMRGTHWTLVGYEAERSRAPVRAGLHVHVVGQHGDIVDVGGHFREAYALPPGGWVLLRPDGYVAAIVTDEELEALEHHLTSVLGEAGTASTQT